MHDLRELTFTLFIAPYRTQADRILYRCAQPLIVLLAINQRVLKNVPGRFGKLKTVEPRSLSRPLDPVGSTEILLQKALHGILKFSSAALFKFAHRAFPCCSSNLYNARVLFIFNFAIYSRAEFAVFIQYRKNQVFILE